VVFTCDFFKLRKKKGYAISSHPHPYR
jgi:hypothetical protein